MSDRIARLRRRITGADVPAVLIRNPTDVGYLTGFSGSTAALLLGPDHSLFITDSRYRLQAEAECPTCTVVMTEGSGSYGEKIAEQVKALGVRSLGIEADYVTVSQLRQLEKLLTGIELNPLPDLVGPLRRIKDPGEIAVIRAACEIADRAFEFLLTLLRPGLTEREVAVELEYFMKKAGSEKEAFDTTVASGVRSALPHGRASDKPLEAGDFITFDYGARVQGYNSDITRTVVLGEADARQREIYAIVLEAQLAALAAIRAGAAGKAVDAAARDLIAARGYGAEFGHGLGHGLGRDVHDHPAMSPRTEVKLEAGMVVTVEPGIYVDGWGGVRIEDDVVVTEAGCEILTHASKELIELTA